MATVGLVAACVALLLLQLLGGAQGERLCRDTSCSQAISIVRAIKDFARPDGTFSFFANKAFPVMSKDGDEWEAEVHKHLCVQLSCLPTLCPLPRTRPSSCALSGGARAPHCACALG
jgi:hypothetical protein